MIDDLLALSQIEGEGVSDLERLRVAQVVTEAVDRIRPAAEQAGVVLKVADFSDEQRFVVIGVASASAVFNLLEKAPR